MNFFNLEKSDFDFVPAIYDDAEKLDETNYKVKEQNKWAIFDTKQKKTISLFDYDDIKYNGSEYLGLKNGTWEVVSIIK